MAIYKNKKSNKIEMQKCVCHKKMLNVTMNDNKKNYAIIEWKCGFTLIYS